MIANFPVWGKVQKGLPAFTYSGTYEEHPASYYGLSGDYTVVAFLSSGTLAMSRSANVDVFMVGGGGSGGGGYPSYADGGGGGGGGYTATYANIPVSNVQVTIGEGGKAVTFANGNNGNPTMFGEYSVNGGNGGFRFLQGQSYSKKGGNGGSGGGAGGSALPQDGGDGGENGNDGGSFLGVTGGVGQHSTTRAFEENLAILFAGGGGGYLGEGGNGGGGRGGAIDSDYQLSTSGQPNTGGGGGGGGQNSGNGAAGGSGIVLMRIAQS